MGYRDFRHWFGFVFRHEAKSVLVVRGRLRRRAYRRRDMGRDHCQSNDTLKGNEMICDICRKDKIPLILNVCEDCDPELHNAWNHALNSSIDYETVTPEMVAVWKIMEDRKLNGWGKENPVGILPNTLASLGK